MLWIIDIYGFMVAGSLITMGTVGDRIGRRKLLDFARHAFTQGLQISAAISDIGSFALAVFTVMTLRNARTGGQAQSHSSPAPAREQHDQLVEQTQ